MEVTSAARSGLQKIACAIRSERRQATARRVFTSDFATGVLAIRSSIAQTRARTWEHTRRTSSAA